MKRFCFHAGLMLVLLSLVNQGLALAYVDVEIGPIGHVHCTGNATCEARSAQPGDPGPAVCMSLPEPCTYVGPNGDACACEPVPTDSLQCRCYVN